MDRLRTYEDCEGAPRPVSALASDHPDGDHVAPHRHPRAQLIHTLSGVMTVTSRAGSWVVPAGRAVWMPPHEEHAIRIAGHVSMRTVFVRDDARACLPQCCEVLEVSPFLREAIVAATSIPLDYATGGRDARIMELILDEIEAAPRLYLHVPMPRDPRLARLCAGLIANPAAPATLERLGADIHVSGRTLARMFHRELGMSFGEWLRRMRLLLSLPRLAAGVSVLEVAMEHGYDSPSAFAAMFRRTLGVSPTAYFDRDQRPPD
ncbi:MAG: helix-turn-helix transcriptional regulator [Candidatus Sphingomonas phytovorans]|nr:helix-turn-helix transcriptional regulator [Sphingomonas sp.]WEK00215.1 MAG: helix-turn-helix transcriptional regulator [Sphingomonas sp.]